MVVTLLALLFVIVSGYLTLARFDRQTLIIAQQGNTTDEIVDGVNNLVLSLVREQWADDNGELLTGADPQKYAYEDIPGYRRSNWLAAPEPVVNRNPIPPPISDPPYDRLESLFWPAVSSLDPGDQPIRPSIRALMLKQNDSALNTVEPLTAADARRNARLGFMDADGDGVPDAGLLASAVATELANTMAGTSVRLRGTGIDSSRIPQDGNDADLLDEYGQLIVGSRYWDDFWRRYNELARYEVAVRVVPHGGMVALSSPGQYATGQAWNREFVTGMFNWIRKQRDPALQPGNDVLFNEVFTSAAAVEPYLGRRNGLLPSYRDENDQDDFGRVPAALRDLEENYASTFLPGFWFGMQRLKQDNWQRFNLSDANEVYAWRFATYLDPDAYNRPITRPQAVGAYDRRHLITAVSYSDDLAREQTGTLPGGGRPGIWPGQLKFYLGKITDPTFDPNTGRPRGAFDGNGNYQAIEGPRIVRELAAYFHEMLSAYGNQDWPDWPLRPGWAPLSDAEKRYRQAYMLAVNAVAFAAPRQTNGFVDVVTCAASPPGSITNTTYIGYAPQPFITQALLYDDDPTQNDQDLALAVELYNPHDPTDSVMSNDQHALNLGQFCITLNDADPNRDPLTGRILSNYLINLPSPGRMPGRYLVAFAVHATSGNMNLDNYFTNNRHGVIADLAVDSPAGSVTVRLWRQSSVSAGAIWYLVDELEVEEVVDQQDTDWWKTVYRDTRNELYFGDYGGLLPACWRVATNFDPTADNQHESTGAPDVVVLGELGTLGPQPTGTTRGPTVPLCTMNAVARNDWPVHGALRPRSFPTVGFMLFVPRFSHTKEVETSLPPTVLHRPISTMLEAVWNDEGYDVTTYPADFGHMPIFDNQQGLESGAYGDYFDDDEAGKIPWGLLVFDYFTTLNPDGADGLPNTSDDIDPHRVAGRININAAPWYVLAGLPIVNPVLLASTGASPAFWNADSGVLLGLGADGTTVRFIGTTDGVTPRTVDGSLPFFDPGFGSFGAYRLGPHLAQNGAAYRDRIRYLPDTQAPYPRAEGRNDEALAQAYRYRDEDGNNVPWPGPHYGRIRRGAGITADPTKYGYLTLGELLNVHHMDSGVLNFNNYPDQPTHQAYGTDFVKAVSLLALLDTHFLTTRSNTFTAYVTVTDRQNPQQSVRSQITLDRSNILPRLVLDVNGNPIIEDPDGAGPEPAQAVVITKDGLPEVIAERRVGYHNARFDD